MLRRRWKQGFPLLLTGATALKDKENAKEEGAKLGWGGSGERRGGPDLVLVDWEEVPVPFNFFVGQIERTSGFEGYMMVYVSFDSIPSPPDSELPFRERFLEDDNNKTRHFLPSWSMNE